MYSALKSYWCSERFSHRISSGSAVSLSPRYCLNWTACLSRGWISQVKCIISQLRSFTGRGFLTQESPNTQSTGFPLSDLSATAGTLLSYRILRSGLTLLRNRSLGWKCRTVLRHPGRCRSPRKTLLQWTHFAASRHLSKFRTKLTWSCHCWACWRIRTISTRYLIVCFFKTL